MKKKIVLALMLAVSLVLAACGNTEGDGEGGDTTELTFGINNWAENIAVSNMWKILLAEEGYEVTLKELEKGPVWTGIAQGDLDVAPEVWLPFTDAPLYEQYEEDVVLGDVWYEGTALGLAVPTYMEDLNSLDQLNDYADDLGNRIVGIDAGSSLVGITGDAVDEYSWTLDLVPSSEPAMMTELDKAYQKQEPIVVTLWSPHWAFAEYDLKYLEDPKGVYGEPDDIMFMTRTDFEKDHPEVWEYLQNWSMDDATLGSLMATINETGDPVEGAQQWIDENRDLVDSWME
ncbi:glycine betaine ABC transporter substrate-binding protein [Bacillus carboniphilus]|uniref:Glycine betaine ABC transporter substrate-binding protein n=1 Tax=Bacillus carboniphilus TaxID=86663 RepID=A0ABP3FX26_9BACI